MSTRWMDLYNYGCMGSVLAGHSTSPPKKRPSETRDDPLFQVPTSKSSSPPEICGVQSGAKQGTRPSNSINICTISPLNYTLTAVRTYSVLHLPKYPPNGHRITSPKLVWNCPRRGWVRLPGLKTGGPTPQLPLRGRRCSHGKRPQQWKCPRSSKAPP